MSKTPREVLKEFYVTESQDIWDDVYPLTAIDTALAELKEAVLAAVGKDVTVPKKESWLTGPADKPNSYHNNYEVVRYAEIQNELRAEVRKTILTLFEGE